MIRRLLLTLTLALAGCAKAPLPAAVRADAGGAAAGADLMARYRALGGYDRPAMARRAALLAQIAQADDPRVPAFLEAAARDLAAHPVDLPAAEAAPAAQGVDPRGMDRATVQGQAEAIAARIIRHNTRVATIKGVPGQRWVLQAGAGHFDALWARDAGFGCLGALAIGEPAVVRDSLDALLALQRADGLLPRRIGRGNNAWGIVKAALGLAPRNSGPYDTAEYKSGLGQVVVDTNALAIWLAAEYVTKTGDAAFADGHWAALERALAWLDGHGQDGLVVQGPYEDWKDFTKRTGKVLYTNVLYYRAADGMARMAKARGDQAAAARHAAHAADVARRIEATFWDPAQGFYRDTDAYGAFSADGNFLAIDAGLATGARATAILDRADAKLRKPWGWYAGVETPYPAAMVPAYLGLFGMRGYGDDTMDMSLITGFYAMAAARAGQPERGWTALEAVARTTVMDGTFEEVYERDAPKAVKRRFYRSEPDFTWSAGIFLRAADQLRAR